MRDNWIYIQLIRFIPCNTALDNQILRFIHDPFYFPFINTIFLTPRWIWTEWRGWGLISVIISIGLWSRYLRANIQTTIILLGFLTLCLSGLSHELISNYFLVVESISTVLVLRMGDGIESVVMLSFYFHSRRCLWWALLSRLSDWISQYLWILSISIIHNINQITLFTPWLSLRFLDRLSSNLCFLLLLLTFLPTRWFLWFTGDTCWFSILNWIQPNFLILK